MSLGQSVVGTFGVTYDDGDPDERSGTGPVAGVTVIDIENDRLTGSV